MNKRVITALLIIVLVVLLVIHTLPEGTHLAGQRTVSPNSSWVTKMPHDQKTFEPSSPWNGK